jgi:hypothetical protein
MPYSLSKDGTRRYPDLTGELWYQWESVPESHDQYLTYRPCRVTLDDGTVVDCVYIIQAQLYIKNWGVWPDPCRGEIDLARVVRIEESPSRLPPEIADKIYAAGESGMGYCLFTLIFRDGTSKAVVTGNAVDFVRLPRGQTMSDIVDVKPHAGRETADQAASLKYHWCLFGEGRNPYKAVKQAKP